MKIEYTKFAGKIWRKLVKKDRILKNLMDRAIRAVALNPSLGKQLKDHRFGGMRSYRFGNGRYRLIYGIRDNVMRIYGAGERGYIYEKLYRYMGTVEEWKRSGPDLQ